MEAGAGMKLDEQEKHAVVGAIKAMFAATPEAETNTRLFYVDTVQRIEADAINPRVATFLGQLADKILERTERLMSSGSIAEEVIVRASVVKDLYARIKEKVVTNEQSK